MKNMTRFKLSMLISIVMVLASVSMVSAQLPANQTKFTTSITYQNVGTGTATVSFQFFNEKASTSSSNPSFPLNAGAGSSLFVGSLTGNQALPDNFQGSAVLSSDQPIVATLVQVPQSSTTVQNRALSKGFSSATSSTLLATVLKNTFNTNSKFSIQNADSGNVDITLKIYNADNPAAPPISIPETNVPQGAAKYYDMATLTQLASVASFNGSATVSAVKSGTTTAANIVASVVEYGLGGSAVSDVKAFEGVAAGGAPVFMATALCNVFGGTNTAYAVQNVDTTSADVTVNYSTGQSEQASIAPGTKKSFLGCTKLPANTSGAATIVSTAKVIVIGKVFGGGLATAFLGENTGNAKLALPYVRYCNDTTYAAGTCQRTFIAIQNVGSAAVSNVTVKYQDKNGTLLGTHTIASIAPGAKANSTAVNAGNSTQLIEFGTPASNPGGGFGGAVIIEGPAGSQLVAIARVQSKVGSASVAEDYNGTPVQ